MTDSVHNTIDFDKLYEAIAPHITDWTRGIDFIQYMVKEIERQRPHSYAIDPASDATYQKDTYDICVDAIDILIDSKAVELELYKPAEPDPNLLGESWKHYRYRACKNGR